MNLRLANLTPVLAMAVAAPVLAAPAEQPRPRLVVLTDIGNEPDDSESMVRLLLYANDLDIEGLIATTSRHHPKDPRPELITRRLDAYGAVLANLRKHDPRYPEVAQLRAGALSGSPVYGMSGVGPGKDTAASRLIIAAVDRPDPRPVWVAAWGGAADLAQALWSVRATRSPEEVRRFVSKLRVYSISDQDDAGPWARAYFPELFWVTSVHAFTNYDLATWTGISAPQPGADQGPVSKEWLASNIRAHGPLGELYPLPAYIMEGDTPSYLGLIPNGLNIPTGRTGAVGAGVTAKCRMTWGCGLKAPTGWWGPTAKPIRRPRRRSGGGEPRSRTISRRGCDGRSPATSGKRTTRQGCG
jgi:Protein of unknown function (DUF1593)